MAHVRCETAGAPLSNTREHENGTCMRVRRGQGRRACRLMVGNQTSEKQAASCERRAWRRWPVLRGVPPPLEAARAGESPTLEPPRPPSLPSPDADDAAAAAACALMTSLSSRITQQSVAHSTPGPPSASFSVLAALFASGRAMLQSCTATCAVRQCSVGIYTALTERVC